MDTQTAVLLEHTLLWRDFRRLVHKYAYKANFESFLFCKHSLQRISFKHSDQPMKKQIRCRMIWSQEELNQYQETEKDA